MRPKISLVVHGTSIVPLVEHNFRRYISKVAIADKSRHGISRLCAACVSRVLELWCQDTCARTRTHDMSVLYICGVIFLSFRWHISFDSCFRLPPSLHVAIRRLLEYMEHNAKSSPSSPSLHLLSPSHLIFYFLLCLSVSHPFSLLLPPSLDTMPQKYTSAVEDIGENVAYQTKSFQDCGYTRG